MTKGPISKSLISAEFPPLPSTWSGRDTS